jgi:hypothetical protein
MGQGCWILLLDGLAARIPLLTCFCSLPCCLLQAVGELLEVMGAHGSLLVQVPAWHYADPQLPAGATSLPLRDALERCYDLRQPKPELLQLLHGRLAAASAAAAPPAAGAGAEAGQLPQEPVLLPAIGKLQGKQQHVRGKDSASELSAGPVGAAMAQEQHEWLCGQGCVVDRLEVRARLWIGGLRYSMDGRCTVIGRQQFGSSHMGDPPSPPRWVVAARQSIPESARRMAPACCCPVSACPAAAGGAGGRPGSS